MPYLAKKGSKVYHLAAGLPGSHTATKTVCGLKLMGKDVLTQHNVGNFSTITSGRHLCPKCKKSK